jgi:hypothetical protein
MRRLTIAFLISTMLHVLVFFVAFRHRGGEKPSSDGPMLIMYPEWIPIENTPADSRTSDSGGSSTGRSAPGYPGEPGLSEDAAAEGASGGGESAPAGIPVPKPMVPLRSPFAVHGTSAKAKTDSLTAGRVADWFAEQDFSGVKAFHDAVDERIQRRAGGSDVFSPWKGRTAESHREEKNPIQLDFLPDETHVQVMSTLYEKGKATQKDLYLALDPSIPMTAGLLNKQLDFLVETGLLTRKKISPENLLGIATPFGVIPVEMSRKNKLNPVYEYKTQVEREKIMAYLQSNEFLLHERLKKAAPKDTAMVQRLIRRCEKGMGILAR